MSEGTDRQLVCYANLIWDSSRWEGFELRPDDIIISTPPKCGTTWTQMITALLIFQTPDPPDSLAKLSPWFDMRTRARSEVVADLERQRHRRFIKTHTPLPGLPLANGVTYICVGRDPRDVWLSTKDHMANLDFVAYRAALAAAAAADGIPEPVLPAPTLGDLDQSDQERFWQWVMDDTSPKGHPTLRALLAHVQSFWDVRHAQNVVMLHYHDLKADLETQMRALAHRLGITVPENIWPALVRAASFEEMRRRSSATVPNSDTRLWLDNASFFKKARSGEWRKLLDSDEDRWRYKDRVSTLVSPELAEWLHRS